MPVKVNGWKGRIGIALGVCALSVPAGIATAGTIQFTSPDAIPAGENPADVAAADFNHNGVSGLAVTDFDGDADAIDETGVTVLETDGLGGWGSTFKPLTDQPDSIEAARINADDDPDLLVGTLTGPVYLLFGGVATTFGAPLPVETGLDGPRNARAGDVNGDGRLDIVASGQFDTSTAILRQDLAGNFALIETIGKGGGDLATLKLDKGKREDFAVLDSVKLFTYVSRKSGKPKATGSRKVGGDPDEVSVGDFDEDHKKDVVVSNGDLLGLNTAYVTIFRGTGRGTLKRGKRIKVPTVMRRGGNAIGPSDAEPGDIDGDGHLDLVVTLRGLDQIAILFGEGDGLEFSDPLFVDAGNAPDLAAVAELDEAPGTDIGYSRANDVAVLYQD